MAISPLMEIAEDLAVSCDTAASCLALASAQNGAYRATGDIRSRMGRENATLPVSRVLDLAGQLGFTAQHLRGDWQWLELAIETRTILLLLKNANVIVAIGPGRLGAHELVVSDPLHEAGAMIVLPRENLERAWDGDAIALVPQRAISSTLAAPRQITDQSRRQRSVSPWSTLLLSAILICFGLVWLQAARVLPPLVDKLVSSTTPVERSSAAAPAGSPAIVSTLPTDPEPSFALASAVLAPVTDPPLNETQPTEAAPSAVASAPYSATATGNPIPLAKATTLLRANPASEAMAPRDKPQSSASDIAALLARGDDSLRTGDIASARLFYQHCAEAGDAGSALRLGETFDPVFLGRVHLPATSGDMDKALFWYRRAGDLGSIEAQDLLKRLNAN
jgi:hypothetical protein